MRKYKNIILTVAFFAISLSLSAQALNSGYFTGDYKYRHDLNPSLGNEANYVAIPALGSVNVKTMGNFGYDDIVVDNPLYPSESNKKMTTFLNPYIENPLDGFSTGMNKIGVEADIALLSAGFKGFGGYNTIELNLRTQVHGKIPYEFFEFATSTDNKDYNIGDINFDAQSFTELAFGHSRQINDKWKLGAKIKLLFGIANANVEMNNVSAKFTGDTWTINSDNKANVSMKGFKYKSEQKDYEAQDGTYDRINDIDVDGAGISGFGMAMDLGATFKLDENWEFGAALMDLGFIRWSNDMYATNEDKSFTFDGFHDTSIKQDHGNTIDNETDNYSDQISQFYNLKDEGDNGSKTTGIGCRMNLSALYTLSNYKKLKIGFLSATRFLGKHSWTEGRLSGNWEPLPWLNGNINMAVNSYATSLGWFLNIHPNAFNFFIGMDHTLGKLSKEYIPLSSNGSLSVGFNVTW